MSDKMQVLFAKQTGHILAAFTRTADPEGKVKTAELAGGGLLVSNMRSITAAAQSPPQVMLVPAEALDSAVVDFEPAVFDSPRNFVVGGGQVGKLGASPVDLSTSTTVPPTSSVPPPISPPSINFNTNRVTVVLDADADSEKGVCVIVQETTPAPGADSERRIAQGVIGANSHFVSLDWKTSPDGAAASVPDSRGYFILALVAGYQPLFGVKIL
jgi:hypothetical protein